MAGAEARIVAAQRFVHDFGVATDCGWGRHRAQDVAALVELHRAVTAPTVRAAARPAPFEWPAGWPRIPDDDWTHEPVDAFGAAYDSVDRHGWYRNLDPTVEELAHLLADGDVLLDYSGGTGILLDRLKLRMFGTQAGAVIVDSSPKFLRVALEKFRDDPEGRPPAAALPEGREAAPAPRRGARARSCSSGAWTSSRRPTPSTSTPTWPTRSASWLRALRPGGHVLINSGNIRNPRARQ